ncbi:alcohol dehydrogenase catalytic domain-containing protein [Paraburkholderia phenoliruptrix]|uniref:alcohol dehydrogenase catalytic domain-containing protein n=1 Tax=Paraburkholderia phenoliruptrix TaxID=252970 RepID=UPI002869E6B1|nr:alcohol dehydrogenase catalytic domain-containing protein [Paraburkholderia phenoliruptrix]
MIQRTLSTVRPILIDVVFQKGLALGSTLAAGSALFSRPAAAETSAVPSDGGVKTGSGPFAARAYGTANPKVGLALMPIERRPLGPKDVFLDILFCGVCHSDIHTARGEWPGTLYPSVPGHEIVGRVVAVGNQVTKFRVGDIGGVGCMVDSCGVCPQCLAGREQSCINGTTYTYNSPDRAFRGPTLGGYSDKVIVMESFVIRIPPGADLAATAPLLCAGVTTFSPMHHWKLESGQRVGIIGMGGLGHVAVKLAVARKAVNAD